MAFYTREGIRNAATFDLATATKTVIKDDPTSIEGKVVAITGNGEVGYGSAGDKPLGFVTKVEPESNANNGKWIVSVEWHRNKEGVPRTGTINAGEYLVCDGSGGVKSSASGSATTITKAIAFSVDDTNNLCEVYIN